MKIIDLLNKIANGDIELGTKFNWHYKLYDIELIFTERQAALGLYFQQEDRLIGLFERFNYQILNDEVEIIEKEKKIEKLNSLNTDYYAKEVYYERLSKEEITLDIQTLKHWINKIIDYLMEDKQ